MASAPRLRVPPKVPETRKRRGMEDDAPGSESEEEATQCFSRSVRCRNGFKTTTMNGFFTATGLYQTRTGSHSAVGGISTTRRSISIPISFRPLSSSSASGSSCSTLLVNILELLAPILLLSHYSCLRRVFAMHFRLFIIL